MRSKTADVRRVHALLGLSPQVFGEDRLLRHVRVKLVHDCCSNLVKADAADDREAIMESLVMIVHGAIGFAVGYGWDFDAAWHRIQHKLMSGSTAPVDLSDLVAEPAPPLPYPWCTRPQACRNRGFCQAKPVCTE